MSVTVEAHEPLSDLNITPLIDVLLVLIVMFILCLPSMTNELPIDLPGNGAATDAPAHRLAIERDGVIRWDGATVDAPGLDARLRAAAANGAALTFAPDAQARFALVDRTLATVKRAGVTRLGFEDAGSFASF